MGISRDGPFRVPRPHYVDPQIFTDYFWDSLSICVGLKLSFHELRLYSEQLKRESF